VTAATPKPVLDVGGRPFLFWLMRELQRFGIERFLILAGHLAGVLAEAVRDLTPDLPKPADVEIVVEPARAGTGGALLGAGERLDARFLLCNGDSLFDANLARLLADADADPPDVLGRLLLRQMQDAARYGSVTLDGNRLTAFRERPATGDAGLVNAGMYALDRRILSLLSPVCSLERDILPRLAAEGALRGTLAPGWFIDIGVPRDLARARVELPARLHRPALLLDRDGVLNVDHGYVGTRDRFEWIEGARDAVRLATEAGWHVFVATNQSGVARGRYDEDAVRALLAWVAEEARRAGGTIDDARYCPFHPEAPLPAYRRASDWRKPAPGMLLDLVRAWHLDPARCVLVGDQPSDLAAARAAGMAGRLFSGGDLSGLIGGLL
jgi:D,D-heptose 1,7-bisphosphate phosphatase